MLSSDMTAKPTRPVQEQESSGQFPKRGAPGRRAESGPGQSFPTAFYRDMVWNLRNGVVAITRDGRVAVMNDDRLPRRSG